MQVIKSITSTYQESCLDPYVPGYKFVDPTEPESEVSPDNPETAQAGNPSPQPGRRLDLNAIRHALSRALRAFPEAQLSVAREFRQLIAENSS